MMYQLMYQLSPAASPLPESWPPVHQCQIEIQRRSSEETEECLIIFAGHRGDTAG